MFFKTLFKKKSGTETEERKKGEIIDELITNYKTETWNEQPYQKAEFHQCIPNPEKPGELITVQLMTRQLEEMNSTDSLRDVDEPSKKYQKYVMKDANTGLTGLRLIEEKLKLNMKVMDHKKLLR